MSGKINAVVEFELSQNALESLVLLYQPVFSFNALSLYLTLYEIGRTKKVITEKELVHLLKTSTDDIVIQRQELEQMNLVKTYRNQGFTIVLNQPLKAKEFLQHPMYGRLYSIVSGQEALKAMVLKYVSAPEAIIGNDISKRFDPNRLAIWDESLEKEFATQDAKVKDLKPDPNRNTQEHVDIKSAIEDTVYEPVKPRFDIEGFFDSIPNIVYPLEFRTPQIKRLIEEVGTLFDVDFETMKRFMINSSNFETKKFDTKRFVYQLERQYGAMKVDEENPYDVDPVSFIRYKQGYEYVVGSDQNLVKSLTPNFGFSNQVINFLVEYVLKVNDNNLNRAYVEKIASTWKRNNVETLEDAKNQIKEKPKKFEKKKVKYTQEMPEYTQDEALSEDEQEALKASIQAMLEEGE